MSYLLNDPDHFVEEMTEGFVAANPTLVRQVTGGVLRAAATPAGQVAVVIGGGSGHYPAFAGLVGQGLAHGAAMGNLFASPSAAQIHNVAKLAGSGAGVLLTYGNYAGDVLNFDQAQERLNDEGITTRTVVVTDDVYSAGPQEKHKRRGIAGDLTVFRCAAWASEQGYDLDAVVALAARANERTRTIGVAFSGCTLPGSDTPLFTVPPGRMAVGLGIHGEPGIDEVDLPTADELAEQLVSTLLGELPHGVADSRGQRMSVLLNGLGSVKSEELYVTYRAVAALLEAAGVTVVQPEVGEMVTSFEMAGASLTLFWLDEELERAWTSPAYAPAYRKGAVIPIEPATQALPQDAQEEPITPGSEPSQQCGARVLRALQAIRTTVDTHAEELGRLDSVAGDGDHGIGMQRGCAAACEGAGSAAAAGAGAGTVLIQAGDAWADRAGGTSGALWGLALRAVGAQIGDQDNPSGERVAAALAAGRDAVARVGKALPGDKTMLDAMGPFVDGFARASQSGSDIAAAWQAAAEQASAAAEKTADLLPRMGRARPHAQKSVGTPDPGAVSFALAMAAVAAVLGGSSPT